MKTNGQIRSLMFTTKSNNSDASITLGQWIEGVGRQQVSTRHLESAARKKYRQEALLRTTTVAYGLAEMLRRARSHRSLYRDADAPLPPLSMREGSHLGIRNFAVRVAGEGGPPTGVDMLSPRLSMNIVEPPFLRDAADQDDQMGRYLEGEFPTLPEDVDGTVAAVSQIEEDARCHSLGTILYELFSHISIPPDDGHPGGTHGGFSQQPANKKTKQTHYAPLIELGLPSSISLLVQNLLECGLNGRPDDAYDSLDAVSRDLHLLLEDPLRFLFNRDITSEQGSVQLLFRKHTLYGREKEACLITDAFCRVSIGKCEAFFVGGFSGSGKSRLVNSLTARVDVSGGYVLTHKFDKMSQERALLEVVAMFNELCVLIGEKRTRQDLFAIANKLAEEFGADFPMLAQLLPDITALSSSLLKSTGTERGSGIRMNVKSVCFILQRFMRVVTSKSHPAMVFFDDLQWCDNSSLSLMKGILCDAIGSSCIFFVGSYRSNEVADDHGIFHLIDGLRLYGVPTTKLSLEGLNPGDLNTLVSDAMGTLPRITEPLSDIVYQKTKGNPFFVLQFLRSLLLAGELLYNHQKHRWIWDEERISSMDILNNVLCLLSSRMNGLSGNSQAALKVASCFGIKIKESIVAYLSANSEHFNIAAGIKRAVDEGFMVKVGTSEFKFVHDKIREAAYGLIPENEKKKYHFSLGMVLYPMTKIGGNDDVIFSVTDHINHDSDSSELNPELRLDLAKLNGIAGAKAMDLSDYATAHSYLSITVTLLPTDCWQDIYDFTLRSYFLLAKAAYSSGDIEKSYAVLEKILDQAHCLSDKLDAYLLQVEIFWYQEELEAAYTMCYEVLLQLGETIPDMFSKEETKEMKESTSKMLSGLSEEYLLRTKVMESKEQYILQFYNKISTVSFMAKPSMAPLFTCRMVQLTMAHGICKYSCVGFVQYAAMCCANITMNNIHEACKVGKLALSVLKRFDSATDLVSRLSSRYYGYVAIFSEPVQSSVDNLRRGFECGIASGDTSSGFLNAIHDIGQSLIAGIYLPTVLKRNEYYLEVTKMHSNRLAKTTFLLYRDTISILMGKECDISSEVQCDAYPGTAEIAYYHRAIRAFWVGHFERSHHFILKLLQGIWGCRNNRSQVMLYYGLNSFKIPARLACLKLKGVPRTALKTLQSAAGFSDWNFRNKVHLLEAEIFSREGRNDEANASYAAAVASAQRSRFIHEQGLASELAGFHYMRVGDKKSACDLLNQAKKCYEKWGSQMKADSITRQLEIFRM